MMFMMLMTVMMPMTFIWLIISPNVQNHSSGIVSDHVKKLSVEMQPICLLILLSPTSEEELKPVWFALGLSGVVFFVPDVHFVDLGESADVQCVSDAVDASEIGRVFGEGVCHAQT